MSVVTKHDSFDASLSRLEVLKLVAFGVCMQPPYKALPPWYKEQVAPAKALCLAVAFEARSHIGAGHCSWSLFLRVAANLTQLFGRLFATSSPTTAASGALRAYLNRYTVFFSLVNVKQQ